MNGITEFKDSIIAIVLFKKLLHHKEGTIYTFTVIIKCYCKLKNTIYGGFALLGRAIKVGDNPNAVTYSTLINGLIDEGLIDYGFQMASKVLSLNDESVLNNIILYSTIIKAFWASGDYNFAFTILQVMENKNLKPTVHIYGNIINGFARLDSLIRHYILFV